MKIKHNISVCKKGKHYGIPGEEMETIKRVLRAEAWGNFNPVYCTYKGKKCLVESAQGDLSDPFRRTGGYLTTLYITID